MHKQNLGYHHFGTLNLETLACDKSLLYGYFLHHRRELQKTLKTREALLTELRNCYAPPRFFEVNHLSQMHRRCNTGTPIFSNAMVEKFTQKLLYVFYLFFLSACCH